MALGLAFCAGVPAASAQAPAGDATYKTHCAACHDSTSPRVPTRAALQQMPAARILRALEGGTMMNVALTMSHEERQAVAGYLGRPGAVEDRRRPPSAPTALSRSRPSQRHVERLEPGPGNTRFQTAAAAGLSADQVPRLKLKWAFGFDGDVSAYSQPTVLDGHLFVGSAAGLVHAMRADSGCLEWTFQANGPVRAAILAVPVAAGTCCCSAT